LDVRDVLGTTSGTPLSGDSVREPSCRSCGDALRVTFVDLGMSPLCETYLLPTDLDRMEPFYPLHVWVCEGCFLVQLEEYVSPGEIFSDYPYFSSYSESWLRHSKAYVEMIIDCLSLDQRSQVVEIGSNDGYLLQYFRARDVPVLGVEPAANVAAEAISRGIPTEIAFFGVEMARQLVATGLTADLLLGNNVLAQVPDLNAFVEGMEIALKSRGVITMEFPHLMRLVDGNQFDTIYHEHFSYFSLVSVTRVFEAHRLTIFDVEELPTHGGSIRIYARHGEDRTHPVTDRVRELRSREEAAGLRSIDYYGSFDERVKETKRTLLEFFIQAKREGKSIVGYGAPGKGNTLLNYCGVRNDFMDYVVDRSPHKQGRFLPGTHIPIFHPDRIRETRPNYVMIMPWNLRAEIMEQMSFIKEWGGRFVIAIPELTVVE